MNDDYLATPDGAQQAIREANARIAKGVAIFRDCLEKFLEAERVYDAAYSKAYVEADCPQLEKRHHAVLASMKEREARDVAKVKLRYVEARMDSLGKDLSSNQSNLKSVTRLYEAAGVAER